MNTPNPLFQNFQFVDEPCPVTEVVELAGIDQMVIRLPIRKIDDMNYEVVFPSHWTASQKDWFIKHFFADPS